MTTAQTGDDGRFRIEGLPTEAGFRVSVTHSDFTRMYLAIATTARPVDAFDYPRQSSLPRGAARPPVSTGDLDLVLTTPRRMAIRILRGDTDKPAPNVFFGVLGGGSTSGALSDTEGRLVLKLPPGEYTGRANPDYKSIDGVHVLTRTQFTVAAEPAEQALDVHLEQGCVLVLEAVDARTGKGIAGVPFLAQMDDVPGGRRQVQSTTTNVDNPRTDANGRLRAVVYPGEREYSVGGASLPEGYRRLAQTRLVKLPAGQTVVVRFELNSDHE